MVFLAQGLVQLGRLFILRGRGFGHGLLNFLVDFFGHLIAGGQPWQHRRDGDGAQPCGWDTSVRVQALPFHAECHLLACGCLPRRHVLRTLACCAPQYQALFTQFEARTAYFCICVCVWGGKRCF